MIENTTKTPRPDWLLGGNPDAIEAQEAEGQRQLVHSDLLPVDGSDDEWFTEHGFTFGDPNPTDPVFRPATLPDGWTRKGSDHSMWSYIADERGIERVAIFYKAAFYDRSAHMRPENVGWRLARQFAYGDGPDTPPWDVLTEDERDQFIEALRDLAAKPEFREEAAARAAEWLTENAVAAGGDT